MKVAILGAGAFGTALACALGHAQLWARDVDHAKDMRTTRQNRRRLPGVDLPDTVTVTSDLNEVDAEILLLAMPMQQMRGFLNDNATLLASRILVACSKGFDLDLLIGPVGVIEQVLPGTRAALLTGPSFAADIARGLPTALTLAARDDALAEHLQTRLSTEKPAAISQHRCDRGRTGRRAEKRDRHCGGHGHWRRNGRIRPCRAYGARLCRNAAPCPVAWC